MDEQELIPPVYVGGIDVRHIDNVVHDSDIEMTLILDDGSSVKVKRFGANLPTVEAV